MLDPSLPGLLEAPGIATPEKADEDRRAVRSGQREPGLAPTGNANAGTLMSPGTALELAPVDADDVARLDKVTLIALDAATVVTVEYGAYD